MGTFPLVEIPQPLGGLLSRRALVQRLGGGIAATVLAAGSRPARGIAQDATPTPGEHPPGSTFGTHGQLVVGADTVYLCHLPMFMFEPEDHPHNFQVILEVSFAPSRADPHQVYLDDREQSGATLYTLHPDPYEHVDLVRTDGSPLRTIEGQLYRGHFERAGAESLLAVTVNVEHVVYFQAFQPDAEPLAELEYLLFGKGNERFLAHAITGPPDFDQVLSVQVEGDAYTDEELRAGVRLAIPDQPNTIADRLRPAMDGDQGVVGRARSTAGDDPVATPVPSDIKIQVLEEVYFEEGELRVPADFAQTEAEEEAGF